MKKTALFCMLLFLAGFLAGCAGGPGCYEMKRPQGQTVCIPECKPLIQYQGNNFSIKGTNIPIPVVGTTINLGDIAWDKQVLQSAAAASQIMDIQRVSRCQKLAVIATSMTDQKEYEDLLKQIYYNEEKINQLALLITLNNPVAVVNWINAYSTELAPNKMNTAFQDPHSAKAEQAVRGMKHQVFFPKDTKVRSLESFF